MKLLTTKKTKLSKTDKIAKTNLIDELVENINLAEEHFINDNYYLALPLYNVLYTYKIDLPITQFRLAICYLKTHTEYKLAIKLFETIPKNSSLHKQSFLYVGKLHHLLGNFDDAVNSFNTYLKLNKLSEEDIKRTKCEIQKCNNAKMTKMNSSITLDKIEILNSAEDDFMPFCDENESFIAFSSRRNNNVISNQALGLKGYLSSDVYFSEINKTDILPPVNPGTRINSTYDDYLTWLSNDKSKLLIYSENIYPPGMLLISKDNNNMGFYNRKYNFPLNDDFSRNSTKVVSACSNEDGTVYIYSLHYNNTKTTNKSDLYMIRRLHNGKFSQPELLPKEINSSFSEINPFLTPDGKTLYFSSDNENSIGGFDLFKSDFDSLTSRWQKAINLGMPLNTLEDDLSICFIKNNKIAYLSQIDRSNGKYDIYRAKIKLIDDQNTLKGNLISDEINPTQNIKIEANKNN